MTPLSVVTPALNQLHYLRDAVSTLRAQETPAEHFVADGASTDGTPEWLRREDIAHTSERDDGMYAALNRAIRHTGAPLIGQLNCDDLWFPWTVSTVVEAFDRFPDAELVYGDALELRGDRWALTVHPIPALLSVFLETGGFFAQPAVFFRRSLWERLGGFDESLKLLADHEFFLRAHHSGAGMVRVNELLAIQRMAPGQLMERMSERARAERTVVLNRLAPLATRRTVAAAGRLLQAGGHRLGMLAMAGAGGRAWPRAFAADVVKPGAWSEVARAMVTSSKNRRYLQPGEGMPRIFPFLQA